MSRLLFCGGVQDLAVKSNYLTLPEVSRLLDVTPKVVASWIEEGSLRARLTPEGVPAVPTLTLIHLLLRKGVAVPEQLKASIRLLIVDDEPAMLRSTARLFKRAAPHLELSLAEGASNGWRAIRVEQPDVVLLDMYMPEFSGVELCGRIKDLPTTRGVLVIAFCGGRDSDLERQFKHAGAVALLDKPPDVQQLLNVLETESALGPTS